MGWWALKDISQPCSVAIIVLLHEHDSPFAKRIKYSVFVGKNKVFYVFVEANCAPRGA